MQGTKSRAFERLCFGNSLFCSLLLGIIATVCAMIMMLGVFHYSHHHKTSLEQVEKSATNRTFRLAEILSTPIWNVEYDTVERIISIFSDSSTIIKIQIEEPDGKIIAKTVSDNTVPSDKVISKNIYYNDERIGRAVIHLSFAAFKEKQEQVLINYIVIIGALLIAILLLTHKVLDIYLKRPLAQLSKMIDQLRTGTYPDHYPTLQTRELQHIATNFEEMAKQVALREAELTRINKQLYKNIEERKRIEDQLRASQQQFSLVAASTMDGIVECRFNQDSLQYTPRWKDLLGYTDEELTTSLSAWLTRVHPDDRQALAAFSHGQTYNSEGRAEKEYRIKHKDGEYRWFLGRAQVIKDPEGNPHRFIGTHTDITPKKRAEQRLISTKELLQNIINCMPSLIVGVTEKMTITLWNDTIEESSGIYARDAEGMQFRDLLPELSFIERHIQKAFSATTPVSVSKVTSIRKGRPVTYDIVIFPVTISTKKVAVLRIDDITERLRMEERIIQTEKMASITGLAAGMAHEINNPLGGILQGVQNIQRRLSPDLAPNIRTANDLDVSFEKMNAYMEQREIYDLLDGVLECGKRAASIVANMLEFSRSSNIKRTSCNIHSVIDKSIELAANDYQLKTQHNFKQIKIIREYDEDVSLISCAQQEIEQVLLNLLKNAAQAFATADQLFVQPTLVITTQQSASGVMITVADNGPGMSEEIRKRVFEPFYTTKPIGDGTGLGLSVSYFIITNNHSGTISVTSAVNQGSKFNIYLPHAM